MCVCGGGGEGEGGGGVSEAAVNRSLGCREPKSANSTGPVGRNGITIKN